MSFKFQKNYGYLKVINYPSYPITMGHDQLKET